MTTHPHPVRRTGSISHPAQTAPKSETQQAILNLLLSAAPASTAVVDEQYTITAVMLERQRADGQQQSVLVELLDAGEDRGAQRWMAMAYDDLRQLTTTAVRAGTVEAVIGQIPWQQLEP